MSSPASALFELVASLGAWSIIIWATVSIARRKGLNAVAWGVAAGILQFLALLAVMIVRPVACPSCGAAVILIRPSCSKCGAALPARDATEPEKPSDADGQCPVCGADYWLDDYRADAHEIRCSPCGAVLPRRA